MSVLLTGRREWPVLPGKTDGQWLESWRPCTQLDSSCVLKPLAWEVGWVVGRGGGAWGELGPCVFALFPGSFRVMGENPVPFHWGLCPEGEEVRT